MLQWIITDSFYPQTIHYTFSHTIPNFLNTICGVKHHNPNSNSTPPHIQIGGRRGHDRMVVGSTTTCAISSYHHLNREFESRSWRCVRETTLCYKVGQCLATCRRFFSATPVSSTKKTDRHDITEILLKVALNTDCIGSCKSNYHVIKTKTATHVSEWLLFNE
jgi:hypothetical protein